MIFRLPHIDNFSFFFGFLLASLLAWVLWMLRPTLQQVRDNIRTRQAEKKERARTTPVVEEHYRQMVLLQTQGLHLASALFSLDEIVEPPRLLAPPPRVEPGRPLFTEDIVDATLPYLPAWPELAAVYKAPTLSLSQALSGGADVVLVGQTGMGKTVMLAHLASNLARRQSEAGLPSDTLPFFIHAADLDLPVKKDEPLKSIIDFTSEKASFFDLSRIPDFIRGAFEQGKAILLLDGTDEMTPDGLKNVVDFIRLVKRTYPHTHIVTTASTEFLDGLVSMNFVPFSLAAWDIDQRSHFLEKWGQLWAEHVSREAWLRSYEQVDPLLLNGWLAADSGSLTPLELTLKIWGAYAGDIRGPSSVDVIETHLRRLSPASAPREAIELLALQASLAAKPFFDPHEAREWIKSFEPQDLAVVAEPVQDENTDGKKPSKQEKPPAPTLGLISKMADSGLLSSHRSNRMRFTHPIFCGFLAGKALSGKDPQSLIDQSPWIGKFLAMRFLAAQGDASQLAGSFLAREDRFLFRNLLTASRWLKDGSRTAPWRGDVMAKLADLLQQRGLPLGLRGQALAAFIQSGDPAATVLFRKMFEQSDSELLQLVALGTGALKDVKAIDLLAGLLNNPVPLVRRAALLSLVTIGTTPAIDAVGGALVHGDETLRKAAAEALANNSGEGYAMLKEGAAMKDNLMVRRASAYGLGRIHEPWAEEILNNLQVLDDQWVVRNSALEVVEDRQKSDPHIPSRLPPPSESPWLIAFAGKQGMGITPDKPPTDLLLLALKSGDEDERMASLSYLRLTPVEGVFGALYKAMYGNEPILREGVYQTLSEMVARGVEIPDPIQYGVAY
jgi:HEAT repeat protein